MIVANIRSNADLKAKKDLQKQLLDLEVANEEVRQKRQQERGVKEVEAKKLSEQYKTPAELIKDVVSLEKKALDNFIELGFNYTDAGQLTNWVSSQNRLADFNTTFKIVKKDVTEQYDRSILTPEFMKNYLDNHFIDLDSNLGKKFSRDIGADTSKVGMASLEKFMEEIPTRKDIADLKNAIINKQVLNPSRQVESLGDIIVRLLDTYSAVLPDENFEKTAITLSQNERMKLLRRYKGLLIKSQFISGSEMQNLTDAIKYSEDERQTVAILMRLSRQLSYLSAQTVNSFVKIQEDLIKTTIDNPDSNYEALKKDLDEKVAILNASPEFGRRLERAREREESITLREAPVEMIFEFVKEKEQQFYNTGTPAKEYAKFVVKENSRTLNKTEKEELFKYTSNTYKGLDKTFARISELRLQGLLRQPINKVMDMIENPEEYKVRVKKPKNKNATTLRNRERVAIPFLEGEITRLRSLGDEDVPAEELEAINPFEGRGLLSKLKKHFKGDEKLLKKVAKALQESDSESSSDEEGRELRSPTTPPRRPQAELEGKGAQYLPKKDRDAIYSGMKKMGLGSGKKLDENTFKFLGNKDKWHEAFSGVGFKATRIPVGKVGKGVKLEKEDNPTYRQFGKYVIHIPHLVNNNTANFKYPSLGSIPSIKPQTVSEDYKDLILEVLQTGKLNKKELERLSQNEIKHFEKVAVGAGLVEQLGMKVGTTEDDKADAKRFEVLRGEYLAGNNNEKMIKELRMLITKFINNGRLHKTEGLNLLLELSTI
jgi:hypothetical protein